MLRTHSALIVLLCLQLLTPTVPSAASPAGEQPPSSPAAPSTTPPVKPSTLTVPSDAAPTSEPSPQTTPPESTSAEEKQSTEPVPPSEGSAAGSSSAVQPQTSDAKPSSVDKPGTGGKPSSSGKSGATHKPSRKRKKPGFVTIQIGQPSVWSLAQAHYFLTQMHQMNRSLATKMPSIDQLDPNKANAGRLEILKTLLQVDAGFDQSVGVKNRIELDHFREREERKAQAQILLQQRQATLQQLDLELVDLNQQIEVLKVQDAIADKSRGDAPTSEADRKRKEDIARLTVVRDAKKAQRDALQTEIASLTTTATADITTPGLTPGTPPTSTPSSDTTPTNGSGGAPSTALKDFVTEATRSVSASPGLAASVALDNFVGMQYEIIAKQLTLLRDETGPDERIIFLELPTSIYTVDGWANDLIAQVQWHVTGVYNKQPSLGIACKALKLEGQSSAAIYQNLQLESVASTSEVKDQNEESLTDDEGKECLSQVLKDLGKEKETTGSLGSRRDSSLTYTVTPAMLQNMKPLQLNDLGWLPVRTLEIVPRQSALNINEFQATTNYTGVLGLLKLISGFGAQINFQRQRETYQALLQQQVYASGFGKGTPEFGWTFGPLPGSRRIAPGQRTTYAVLAVPRDALAIRLEADGLAFPRKVQPSHDDRVEHRTFLVSIPSDRTAGFWVDRIDYTSVAKGQTVTALIQGRNFSPQLGVLVNGVPLTKSLSITRVGSAEAPSVFPDSGIHGEFESTNSRALVLHFSMGSGYSGTPIITLVGPEKTREINSLMLRINHSNENRRLDEASRLEPMFLGTFSVEPKIEVVTPESLTNYPDCDEVCTLPKDFLLYRLNGEGLRPQAVISIADLILNSPSDSLERFIRACNKGANATFQESTRSYLICFSKPATEPWKVRYSQLTRQEVEQAKFEQAPPVTADFKSELRHYRFNRATVMGEVDLTISFPKGVNAATTKIFFDASPSVAKPCPDLRKDQGGNFRVHCEIPADQGERDFISFEAKAEIADPEEQSEAKSWFFDLRLPVRPLLNEVALPPAAAPSQTRRTPVVLKGLNFHRVTAVLLGNQAAEIDSKASNLPTRLVINIPPKDVPAGEKEQVPIIFQTEDGAIPTGFSYEYAGPPAPKKKEEGKKE